MRSKVLDELKLEEKRKEHRKKERKKQQTIGGSFLNPFLFLFVQSFTVVSYVSSLSPSLKSLIVNVNPSKSVKKQKRRLNYN